MHIRRLEASRLVPVPPIPYDLLPQHLPFGMVFARTKEVPPSFGDYTIFTSQVTKESLEHLERVKLTAHQFQEYIEKSFEVRVTVIGKTALAVAIYSQESAQGKVDWRAGYETLRYSPCALPPSVERQCIDLTSSFGLSYGALDLIVTPEQEYIFLEINPGGQYEWLEQETRLPFSATIADVLLQGKKGVAA